MSTLAIETDITPGVSIIKVKGRVDSETAPQLDKALLKLLADGQNKIVLNLEGVDYISSMGLRSLVRGLKGARGAGGDLRLVSVPEAIMVLLRTVGMLQIFKMFSTTEEATAGF